MPDRNKSRMNSKSGETVPPREYILYADESIERGAFFSNCYGGLLISSRDRGAVISVLEAEKARLNLHGEVKWQRVTLNYLDKYQRLTSVFFNFVRDGRIRMRILFTDNFRAPNSLASLNFKERYLLLYLAFIEHTFDVRYRTPCNNPVRLRLLLDELPVPAEDKRDFRQQLYKLNSSPAFQSGNVRIFPGAIGEIDSRDHVLLQCLDIVLGAMQSRMNTGPPDPSSPVRKRSAAKHQLSTYVLHQVRSINPGFQLEETTPVAAGQGWLCSCRHCLYGPGGIEDNRPD